MDHVRHAVAIAEGNVDDAPAVVAHVVFEGVFAGVECACEVGVYDCLEAAGGEFLCRAYKLTSRVVHEQIEGSVGLYYVHYLRASRSKKTRES